MTPKASELKPCPFCLNAVELNDNGRKGGGQHTNGPVVFWISCEHCRFDFHVRSSSQHRLRAVWNTRPTIPAQPGGEEE